MHWNRPNSKRNIVILTITAILVLFCQVSSGQRNSGTGRNGATGNYKDSLHIYPTGIRSERDLPVCPSLIDEESKDLDAVFAGENPLIIGNDYSKLSQPGSTKNPADSKKSESKIDSPPKYLSACNIIHKRYFFSPMIERLCRCPDRTDCPMEWSQPPKYSDLFTEMKASQTVSTTPSTKAAEIMDPYTIMISSRSQLKFCAEVASNLPSCDKIKQSKDAPEEVPAMVKTIRKTFIAPELPSITLNCYCPPLYREWTFLSKNESMDNTNTTIETNHHYRCSQLRNCKTGQQCGTVRTDYHFSYYHCSCPTKHLCVPKVYPPVDTEDVIDEAEEALYTGQVAPAVCTPE